MASKLCAPPADKKEMSVAARKIGPINSKPSATLSAKRESWADVIRTSSAFMVVWLHVAAPWLHRFSKISAAEWHFANLADSAVRASVPLFFMLSGYFLIRKASDPIPFLRKRIPRLLIPLGAWSAIYVAYNGALSPDKLVHALVTGSAYYHLWFLYALAGCYLLAPILCWALTTPRRMVYALTLWGAAILLPLLNWGLLNAGLPAYRLPISVSSLTLHVGFFIAGHWMATLRPTAKQAWLALAAGFLVTAGGTAYISIGAQTFRSQWYEYATPNVALMAFGLFTLLRHTRLPRVLARVSECSLGIYLIHPMIIRIGGQYFPKVFGASSFLIPVAALLTFAVSFIIVDLLRRLPYLRKVV